MKRPANRRTVLMAGVAILAAATGAGDAQPAGIRGSVSLAGGAAIPQGQIEIYLEDPAIQDHAQRRLAQTHVNSDGKSPTISFSILQPPHGTASPTLQIVARLERADGWLLARGSAQVRAGVPVSVTLNVAMH